MTHWQQLVQQGILGTGRQPTRLELPPEILAHIDLPADQYGVNAQALPTAVDQETDFLQQAAILTQYELGGALPVALDEESGLCETVPAPPETLEAVSEPAAVLLQQLLQNFDLKLILEWLTHASRQEQHVPHSALPALLDHATKQRALVAALSPCLGERGQWLRTLNPAWQPLALEEVGANDWQAGTSKARATHLAELRHHDPAQAGARLRAAWAQEAAAERAALVATLRINLSNADLPFLEEALADRSLNVRIVVSRLLATLPASALHITLLAELTTHLQIERKWLKRQMTVTLPKYFRDEWVEWGIREQSPLGVRIGQKMGWLVQLVALVPPSTLADALTVDAVDLLNLIRATDHAEALLTALLEGAEQHQDYAFLLAELHHLLRLLKLAQAQQSEFIERFARYAPILPMTERTQLLQEYLVITGDHAFGDWTTLQMVLRHVDTLPPALTDRLLAEQLPVLLTRNTRDYGVGRILLDLAYQLAPAGYVKAARLLQSRQGEERPEYFDRFLQIYDIRRQMAEAFWTAILSPE